MGKVWRVGFGYHFGNGYIVLMKEIEKKLKELQKQGVEYVSINDIQHWMYNIRFNKRIKRAEKLEKK